MSLILADARMHLKRLQADVKAEKDTIWIASLTAQKAQDIRMEMLEKVGKLLDELFQVRNAQELAKEGQVHVYRALTTLIRVKNAILSDASLDEIQAMLEDADGEISQAQSTEKSG